MPQEMKTVWALLCQDWACQHNCHSPGSVGWWKGSTLFSYDLMLVLTFAWTGRTKSCHSPGICCRRCHDDSAKISRQNNIQAHIFFMCVFKSADCIFRKVFWCTFIDVKNKYWCQSFMTTWVLISCECTSFEIHHVSNFQWKTPKPPLMCVLCVELTSGQSCWSQ